MNKEYNSGLTTQPGGTPVFIVVEDEQRLPNLNRLGSVSEQLENPMTKNFGTSLDGITVLMAEQNSIKSILTCVF